MLTRDFRCIPTSLLHKPEFVQMRTFERDILFCALLASDDRHALPFDVAILKSTLFPGRSWVNEKNLAEARDHLIALGVFIRKTSTRREGHMYLVISPDWRHEKGKEFGFGDPDDGASDDEGPDLPGFDHAPSPKPAPANPGRSIGRGKAGSTSKSSAKALRDVSRNRSRPESEADSDTESATRRQSPGKADSATPPPPAPSGAHRYFPRWEDDYTGHDKATWVALCRLLGRPEMNQNGDSWFIRMTSKPGAIDSIVREFAQCGTEGLHNVPAVVNSKYDQIKHLY